MSPVLLAICLAPAAVATWIWAIRDTPHFFLYGVLSAMVLPVAIFEPAGTQVALADLLLLVGLAGWAVAAAARRVSPPWLRGNALIFPTAIFVLLAASSVAWSVDRSATFRSVIQLTEIVVFIPLAYASLPRELATVRNGLLLYIATSCVLALVAAVLAAPEIAAGRFEAPTLDFGLNKNAAGSYIAAGLVLAYAFWLKAPDQTQRRLLVLAMAVEVAGLLATLSRGSMIGAGLGILSVSLLLRKRRLVTGFGVLVLLVAFLSVVGPEAGSDLSTPGSYSSTKAREYTYNHAIQHIEERPVLGVGSGAYFDTVPQLGGGGFTDPHNMFLLTWAELGVFGVAALIFLLVRFARIWWGMTKLPDEAASLGVAAGGVSLSLLVHFQFDVTWTRGTTSLAFATMGMMLAVQRLSSSR